MTTSVWLHDRSSCKPFGKVLEKRFEVKQTGHIGFGAKDKEGAEDLESNITTDVLNDEMTLEADTKLVAGALESMKLNDAKGVDSPRFTRTGEQTAQIENSEKLTSAESTLYRSLVMKLACVAQDRVDIAEAVKCFTRHMKELRSGHMQELKRFGRYLVKNRRCVLTWTLIGLEICLRKEEHDRRDREKWQTFVATHVMFADACCVIKRRS